MSVKNRSEVVKLQHFQKKSQLGACKITEFMGKSNTSRHILQENLLLFRKHNWQFYMTAGRSGCDKFQLCLTSAGLPTARHRALVAGYSVPNADPPIIDLVLDSHISSEHLLPSNGS